MHRQFPRQIQHKEKGSVAVMVLLLVAIALELAAATMVVTNSSARRAGREMNRGKVLNLAEAGLQNEAGTIWSTFRTKQSFSSLDAAAKSATTSNPCLTISSQLAANERYTVSVVGWSSPDTYTRDITIVSVGWIDQDHDGALDNDEVRRAIRSVVRYSLSRAGVFDYCYFVNNYGWMNGFGSGDLIVNGDMRANGNFDFSGGTPTINGSVYAAPNDRLIPPADGVVNITPTQWTNSSYNAQNDPRARQAYDPTRHGAKGSTTYDRWKDIIYDNSASVVNGDVTGAVVADKSGTKTYNGTVLDPEPMTTLPMPDLSDITYYQSISTNYADPKQTYADGTANPDYGQPAYIDVWDSTKNAYQRITTNGLVTGNAKLVGDSTHPIRVHGPVTISQDCVITGYVQGQATLYTGRNIHIVGSVIYKDPPNFTGTDPQAIDNANEKKSLLGLAARASIICGDTSGFGGYPLNYMTPPFTRARYDENGNIIPAYDANAVDSYGVKKYQSVLGDNYIHSVSSTISQIDAVLYTNFLGGGNLGGGSGGVVFNGSIISKDEAMVLWSLPFRMNYDNRIRERGLDSKPLIDINLPRTPCIIQVSWQEI